ncbi:MAG: outer membrane lipoprotein chaperone LolA [Enterobacteriaceae bacterium]
MLKARLKQFLMLGVLVSGLFSAMVQADGHSELQKRLNKVKSFHANFVQSVVSADNTLIQNGKGELWIQRPNLFLWHTTEPDESVMVSDGKTLWFYNPFVEQVSAHWLDSATSDTPFMLIARNRPADWREYRISQKGDDFKLEPVQGKKSNLQQFSITVTPEGTIKSFVAVEQDGQRNSYTLSQQNNGAIPATQFHFVLPKGVTLDDQRQKK